MHSIFHAHPRESRSAAGSNQPRSRIRRQRGDICLNDPNLSGIHFTGSTAAFQQMWKKVGENIANYKSYPRIVDETGDKDFVFAHASANVNQLVTGLVRGAFEYHG